MVNKNVIFQKAHMHKSYYSYIIGKEGNEKILST